MSSIKELKDKDFMQEIMKGVHLVDFYADWCGPCRMLSPIIGDIANHFEGKIEVAKIDIDKEQDTASDYQVTSIPTLILFKDGKEVDRLIGLRSFDEIKKMIEAAL